MSIICPRKSSVFHFGARSATSQSRIAGSRTFNAPRAVSSPAWLQLTQSPNFMPSWCALSARGARPCGNLVGLARQSPTPLNQPASIWNISNESRAASCIIFSTRRSLIFIPAPQVLFTRGGKLSFCQTCLLQRTFFTQRRIVFAQVSRSPSVAPMNMVGVSKPEPGGSRVGAVAESKSSPAVVSIESFFRLTLNRQRALDSIPKYTPKPGCLACCKSVHGIISTGLPACGSSP